MLRVSAFLNLDNIKQLALMRRRFLGPTRTSIDCNSDSGEIGSGPNWIMRSFPVDTDDTTKLDPKTVIDYDLGISGVSYQLGPLSKRMFEAIESKSSWMKDASPEVRRGFLIYAMDFTAKEAVRAALKRNGLELVLSDDEQDEGLWGDIDSIKLLDEQGYPIPGSLYESWEDAVDHWSPGQGFDLVARQVPAKMKELSLDELLQALDPKGELRAQAKAAGMRLPDEDINTLKDMADENVRRTEMSPRETVSAADAYTGIPERRGYRVVKASDLLYESRNVNGTENENVLMHVMDAMVNHGCLIVDLTDGGTSFQRSETLTSMWTTAQNFFSEVSLENRTNQIPAMKTLSQEVGSSHAKVGYASYHDGNMQFLETRLDRMRQIVPKELQSLLGLDGCTALEQSFKLISQIGKDIVRIAVCASSRETGILDCVAASESALLVAKELLDDGESLEIDSDLAYNEGSVSMSPHRLCLYSNNQQPSNGNGVKQNKKGKNEDSDTREIFGAHTDSTFVTAVPVASISGLEVYDEDAGTWYRPELAARRNWQAERVARGLNPDVWTETVGAMKLPWHARYVVFLPGELLQLCTRNEVMAAVHRVCATKDKPRRLSAPILLRGRPGIRIDCRRYFGGLTTTDSVLRECDGMTIEEIHDRMQPTSFQ